MPLRVLMIGDVVGRPGRRVLFQQLPQLRRDYAPDLVIANAENAAGGSGLTPQLFRKITSYGVDGITLGDHVYRQKQITETLESEPNIVRPANLPDAAVGPRWMDLTPADPNKPALRVLTLLGRMFMNGPTGDDPFAEADRFFNELPDGVASLIEIHAEATGEKVAFAHHADGRASAVVGTHTHIPTADAKILPGGTAYISDIGMTGPYDSVLGRRKDRVLHYMRTGMPAPFDVAEHDVRLCGACIDIGDDGHAPHIERIEAAADPTRPPFAQET